MNSVKINPVEKVTGTYTVPPDKSMSHRAVLFGSLANGRCLAKNFLFSNDTRATINCFQSLGVEIKKTGESDLEINGVTFSSLIEPGDVLNATNSGTTMRIISGILASSNFFSVITGDESLRRRPMERIIKPLSFMGAEIMGRQNNRLPPLAIRGRELKPIVYKLPVASAQVKSCIIAAALNTFGETVIEEPTPSRDHTERMLQTLGAGVDKVPGKIKVAGKKEIPTFSIFIPGDVSSAAYLITAVLLTPNSKIVIKDVGLNPTRCGFLDVLKRMGASIKVENKRTNSVGEPYGDLAVESSDLSGVEVGAREVPLLIDEIPLLAVLGAKCRGKVTVSGASELRVKETDRIKVVAENLQKMGVEIQQKPDGFTVEGGQKFRSAVIDPAGDHRIAMTFAVAALSASEPVTIKDPQVASVSYPGFWSLPFFAGTG